MGAFEEAIERREIINSSVDLKKSAILENLEEYYRPLYVWSTNAIEGNPLTLEETSTLILDGIAVGGIRLEWLLEAMGGSNAYSYMFDLVRSNTRLSIEEILKFHEHVMLGNSHTQGGTYRKCNVKISGCDRKLPEWDKVPDLMEEYQAWLENNRTSEPLSYAAEAHCRLVSLHPFQDGNGRVARLVMNTILLQSGYLPVCITPKERCRYIAILGGMDKSGVDEFATFISEIEIKAQKDYMKKMHIKEQAL